VSTATPAVVSALPAVVYGGDRLTKDQWNQRVKAAATLCSEPLQITAMTCCLSRDSSSTSTPLRAVWADLVGLQACSDPSAVLIDEALNEKYTALRGPDNLAIVYATADWKVLGQGHAQVAVDEVEQFQGVRSVQWSRLRHQQNAQTVFFVNHEGPMRVNSGGRHGGPATAAGILRTIYENIEEGDAVILAGNFNAQPGSQTVRELEAFLPRVTPLEAMADSDMDHMFSSLEATHAEPRGANGESRAALVVHFAA